MGGRRSHGDKGGDRAQARKQPRGFARGHGAHHRHRPGKEAPRPVGTGRDRTQDFTRAASLRSMDDESLSELGNVEKPYAVERRLEELGDAHTFGAKLDGPAAHGIVLEVRKGNFLTELTTPSPAAVAGDASDAPTWNAGAILRTFVRGTMQQFDLGLSSLVAPGDEIDTVVPHMAGENELFQHGLHCVLTKVYPRRNEFRRLHPSGRAIQTLAANVDRAFIVASAAEPDFRPGFVDRVLVCAAASGIPVSLVVNKLDLGLRESDQALLDVYRGLGIPVFTISLVDAAKPAGDFDALVSALQGARTILTGHSGVGKSSLLRALDPSLSEEQVRVSEVSTQTGKGAHTTTHARLFRVMLRNGQRAEIVDTPGVREFTPADTDRRNLWGWFPEIARLQGQCGYSDCTHTVEKNCAVLAAVERGEIHPRRHHSYVRIYQTLPT